MIDGGSVGEVVDGRTEISDQQKRVIAIAYLGLHESDRCSKMQRYIARLLIGDVVDEQLAAEVAIKFISGKGKKLIDVYY